MPIVPAPTQRAACASVLLLALPLFGPGGLGERAAAEGAGELERPGAADAQAAAPAVGGVGDRPLLAADVGSAPAAPEVAPPVPPVSAAERLRIRLLGGNPIFALDWLASGPEAGRLRPELPLP